MRLLFLEWASFGNNFIKNEFIKKGYEIVSFDFPQKTEDTRRSEELATNIANVIIKEKPDFVFSFNYFPVAAIAASACKVKYLSWTYDCPYVQLYSKTIDLPGNYAFVFDKSEYLKFKSLGVESVFYLPMAGAAEYYDQIELTEEDHAKYDADIAMVGSMYTETKQRLYRHFDKLDDYTKGYLDGLMAAQKLIYGASIIEDALDEDTIARILKCCPITAKADGYETTSWILSNYFIARELTARERKEYIEALSELSEVAVYTAGDTKTIKGVINRGTAEYYTEAPKAMKCAKINLNISLRSIVTGIPLRAFDIMACGGFLLTNYQADFMDFFVPNEDFVYFESKEDLVNKANYYLCHDEERQAIALNAYKKIKKFHSYSKRLDEMLRIAGF